MARRVTPNRSGIIQTLKSPGVKSFLKGQADAARARCNAAYSYKVDPDIEPYGSNVEEHRVTAVGRIFTYTELGRLDNLENNTLKKGTGW
jgi:hypothetical protein|nr:MAG TPA: hypothetical protein [Caudoviricetes sp.]